AICLFVCGEGICEVIKVEDYGIVRLGIGIFLFGLWFIWMGSSMYLIEFINCRWVWYWVRYGLLLGVFVLGVELVRKRGE
ncbi:hypothetical protein, partial [Priestia megaterium]|uniref:hypothetical protein n=1 Tax=Priestia megaterium TaxID=1404 RepID=UPI001C98F387